MTDKKKKPKCEFDHQGEIEEQLEKYEAWQEEQMEKHGWFVHYVFDDTESPNGVNFHTHGMEETYQHLDFQMVFPLQDTIAHSIFWEFANKLKKGQRFSSGERVSEIIRDYDVLLLQVDDNGRDVLRIIFPDDKGNLEKEKMTGKFASQFEGTTE